MAREPQTSSTHSRTSFNAVFSLVKLETADMLSPPPPSLPRRPGGPPPTWPAGPPTAPPQILHTLTSFAGGARTTQAAASNSFQRYIRDVNRGTYLSLSYITPHLSLTSSFPHLEDGTKTYKRRQEPHTSLSLSPNLRSHQQPYPSSHRTASLPPPGLQ